MPGGYDITRLPLAVAPTPDEQLASWLARWAYRYRLPVSQLLSELGAGVPAAPAARVERHLEAHADRLAAAAGLPALPPTRPRSPLDDALTSQVGRYLSTYHPGGRGPVQARTRFCPSCLAETGGAWLSRWAAPLEVVCAKHQVLLVRRCPSCRRSRFTTSSWMTHDTPPWVCSEPAAGPHQPRARYTVCGQDLRTVAPTTVDGTTLDVQRWIRILADQAATAPTDVTDVTDVTERCGFAVTHQDLFDAALELVVEGLNGTDHLTRTDREPTALLAAMSTTREILTQPDADTAADLADEYRLLGPSGTVTPIAPDFVLNRRLRNPLLAAIRLNSLRDNLPPSSQLVFRTGSNHPRYPQPPRSDQTSPTQDHSQLAWIPQQLWPGTMTPWIADHDHLDRAAAAMLLAKVGSTRPWRLIAVDFGLPASFAVHPPNLVRHLQRIDAWPAVLRRLDGLATSLEAAPPPIDYQTRRWAAADQDLIVAAVNRTRGFLGPVHGWVSTHLLAELFWQVYTGGDLRLATPTAGTMLDPDLYHDDEGTFVGPVTDPSLLRFLAATADLVSDATGQDSAEPLTWQPP